MWPEEPTPDMTSPRRDKNRYPAFRLAYSENLPKPVKSRQVMRAEIRAAVEREERIHWPRRKRHHCFQTVAVREIDKGIWWRRVLTPEQLEWCRMWVKRSLRRWAYKPVEL